MARRSSLLALLILLIASPAAGAEAVLPRHPAPSPDGSSLAFSWQGDLWLVAAEGGEARRLTAHPAADRNPVWSRDGRLLAFASTRYGNEDVFVLAMDGSEPPRRLTWADTPDLPVDFTPEGGAILFSSRRDEAVRWMPALHTVPVAGGTPALAQPSLGEAGAYSPGGEALAFVRGSTKWTRRGYRGAANREIWLRNDAGEERALTDFEGDDDHPGWVDGETLVFLSARSGRKNVFLLDLASGEVRPLTTHEGSDARAPRVSADGSLVAYEFEEALWTVRPGGGEATRLSIEVPADRVRNKLVRHDESKGASELSLGPKDDLAAVVVHGDVFVTPVWSKEDQDIAAPPTARISETPFREQALAWSPEGDTLVYGSDRDGQEELYRARPAGETPWAEAFRFEETRLTDSPEPEYEARFSPDGSRLAYLRGGGTLVVAKADGSEPLVLLEHWTPPDYSWSPDGKWIAYSVPDTAYNHEIWIVSAEGGEPYNVSRHPDDDTEPRWSPDGKRLVWITARHQDTADVWGVWLTRADHERTPEGWLRLWQEDKEKKKKKKRGKGAKGKEEENGDEGEKDEDDEDDEEAEKKELPKIVIDFEDLWERVGPITAFKGNEGSPRVAPDGKTIVFTSEHEGERDLYAARWDGKEPRRLTTGGESPRAVQIDEEGETVFYLDGKGVIRRVSLEGKSGDPVPFRARFVVDREKEREVIVREAWRVLDLRFYDPDFHEVDWKAQLSRYLPWALAASDPADFTDVMNLMLGELNASHMGYYPPPSEGGETTGWIGALFDPAAGGPGLLVKEVLRDSPAGRQDVALKAGERILEVAGRPLKAETNIYSLFVDTVGHRVPVKVQDSGGEAREVLVIPVSERAERQLRYGQWTRQRREMVERLSGGRLGYLHIQGMDLRSFEEFERNLHAAGAGREGLVIDVRSNGGGWTTDLLMAVLSVRRHAYTIPRGAPATTRNYPQSRLPLAAWTGPVIVLCNEDSYSNAEIFSHAIKTLDRGLLVGMPTFGAVISTGAAGLLDGGRVRVPERGWFVAGSDINMERQGAVPDILVEQPPAQDTSATDDDQLERAVSEFLAVIESDPRHGTW